MTTTPWAHVFLDVPADLAADTAAFWAAVTGWPVAEPWSDHPEFVSLEPPDGSAYVHVQRIDGPPRVHLDLMATEIDAEADRLVALGARRGQRHDWWQVMESPGGLPFCLCRDREVIRPGPTRWPDGHHSRPALACVDVPADQHDAELDFWADATGWERRPGSRSEYAHLLPPPESPQRLLLQRLEADDAGTSTRAHIDIGSDDIAAEADRVERIGARVLDRFERWVVFEDPAGLPFCVTGIPPA